MPTWLVIDFKNWKKSFDSWRLSETKNSNSTSGYPKPNKFYPQFSSWNGPMEHLFCFHHDHIVFSPGNGMKKFSDWSEFECFRIPVLSDFFCCFLWIQFVLFSFRLWSGIVVRYGSKSKWLCPGPKSKSMTLAPKLIIGPKSQKWSPEAQTSRKRLYTLTDTSWIVNKTLFQS